MPKSKHITSLSKYFRQKIRKNLITLMQDAMTSEIIEGIEWYAKANKFAVDLSREYDVSVDKIVGVISALSPRNKWHTNLANTRTVVDAWVNGKGPQDVKVSTFHANKYKAFHILDGKVLIGPDSRKTYSFVHNIAYLSVHHITVDVWHLRACFLPADTSKVSYSVNHKVYDEIVQITLEVAKEFGFNGYEAQAIIWVVTQRFYGAR